MADDFERERYASTKVSSLKDSPTLQSARDRFSDPGEDYSEVVGNSPRLTSYQHLEEPSYIGQAAGYRHGSSSVGHSPHESPDRSLMYSDISTASLSFNSGEWVDIAKSPDVPPEAVGDSIQEAGYVHDILPSLKDEFGNFKLQEKDRPIGDTGIDESLHLKQELPEVPQDEVIDKVGLEDTDVVYDWLDVLGNGDVMKKVIKPGVGKSSRPDRGHIVTVDLNGYLESGARVEWCPEFKFTVGDAEVVQGLDLAIPLMELGETCEIVIQSRFAYGSVGRLPEIPPDSTIKYNLKLLRVEDEPDAANMSIAARMEKGSQKRERGNFWYGRGDFSHAVLCYRRALDFLDDESQSFTGPPEELQRLLEARIKVYNNMAAAQMKMEAYDAASKSVDNVLRVQPDNVKAIYRKAKVLANQGNLNDAIMYMRKAIKLEPDTKLLQQELGRLVEKKRTESYFEREMYRRMIGQGRRHSDPGMQKRSPLTMWASLLGGVAAVAVGIIVYRQYHGGW